MQLVNNGKGLWAMMCFCLATEPLAIIPNAAEELVVAGH